MKYTVLGASGFIGSHLAALAQRQGHDVFCPARDAALEGLDLGHVIYAIGLTSDFRQRPHDTVTAHVTKLQEILTQTSFDSLVYLSSTRVYSRCLTNMIGSDGTVAVSEETPVSVLSSDFSDLYNISKLMGESLALTHGRKVKIARLSNVVGMDVTSDNFLISVLREGLKTGRVELRTALDSAKDYVSVSDVADILLRLGTSGKHSIYNLASGVNTTHREIVARLGLLTGTRFHVAPGSPTITFPPIDVRRLVDEFQYAPRSLDAMICSIVSGFRSHFSHQTGKYAA
ncbi:NAD-dependent epimerase/dehydratase family protein [Schlesneria paludicola]|uniref:NAD-dependent epimerase/dehydratase family protein n=1 Tax=Schlesneria paludicola TaxID=360056 RepID=UPI00029A551C|nr:NAD-dependent epimerase/dehydratase family protein [Schlesneria paludicola]